LPFKHSRTSRVSVHLAGGLSGFTPGIVPIATVNYFRIELNPSRSSSGTSRLQLGLNFLEIC
jgi:hypothetical protein